MINSCLLLIQGDQFQQLMFYHANTHPKYSTITLIAIVLAMVSLNVESAYTTINPYYWGSYQYRIAYLNGSDMVGTTAYTTYNVPFANAVNNILDLSVVVSGYQVSNYDGIYFRVTKPFYNTITQSAQFAVQIVSPSSFAFLRFFIVYNTQLSSSFFEINVANVTCTIANGAVGVLKTQPIISSTRFHVGGADVVKVQPVLSSMMLSNSNTTTSFALSLPGTPITATTLTVNLVTTSSITEIVITTFILKTNLVYQEYIFRQDLTISIPRTINALATLCLNNFNIPAKYGPNLFNINCCIGLNKIQDDNVAVLRKIDFDATVAGTPAFSSCSNSAEAAASGVMTLGYSSFCSTQILCGNTTQYYNLTSDSCLLCTALTALCTTCNRTNCLTCETGYYPLNLSNGTITCPVCTQANCTICLSVSTCGACSNSSYLLNATCVSCTLVSNCLLCSSNITCLLCVDTYGLDPTYTCQLCTAMIPQCSNCSTYYHCNQCTSGYFVSPSNASCAACSSNITNCDTCLSGSVCQSCITGYYLISNISCTSCTGTVPNCMTCSNNGTCTSCSLGYYLFNSSCHGCTITGCQNCSSAIVCVVCNLGYYIDLANSCTACADPNCINCTSLICNQCDSDFNLSPNQTVCTCKVGSPVTNVCTNVIGCVAAVKINGTSTCIFCHSTNNFIIAGTTCACKTGYKLYSTQCLTVCGDGLVISPEQCDDGNTESGDGCSSTCTLQPNYSCAMNNGTYKCIFTATFTINLLYIKRHETDNSCTYYFSVQPLTPNFLKMNMLGSFNLYLPSLNYTTTGISYNEGTISIDVSFTQDIENLDAVFSLNFDPTYFNTTYKAYPFVSTGTNRPLIVTNYAAHLYYIKIVCYFILGLALLILLLSITYQKMIGIETINILQIIVFSKLLYVQSELLVSEDIMTLKYIYGYNDVNQSLQHSHQLPVKYRRFLFNSDYILNFQTGLLLMVLSIIIYILIQIYRKREISKFLKRANQDEYKLAEQRISEKQRFFYERFVLVIACLTLFDSIASVRLQSRVLAGESHYTYFLLNLSTMLFSIFYIFSILTYQVLNVGKEHTCLAPFCSYSQYYIGYYICYILIITPILVGGEQFEDQTAIFILSGFVLINLVIIVIWRPYKQIFHNFAIIFNNSVLLFVLGLAITMKITNLQQKLQLIFAYVLLGLIFIQECLALVRLYLARLPLPKEGQRFNKAQKIEEVVKGFEVGQKQKLKKSKRMIQNTDQEQQTLKKLRNRLKQEFKAKNEEQIREIDRF